MRTGRAFLMFILGCALLAFIFQKNVLGIAPDAMFDSFQTDSESLVIGGILARKYGIPHHNNLGFLVRDGKTVADSREAMAIPAQPGLGFSGHASNYGGQAVFYASVASLTGLGQLSSLQFIASGLLAVIVCLLAVLYSRIYDRTFALMFLIGVAGSPWMVSFARNLYWSPFLWFLPALFAALLYLSDSRSGQIMMLGGVMLAMMLKCLAGYEYITAVTLLACSVGLAAPLFAKNGEKRRGGPAMAGLVFAACVLGFVLALMFHANIRGETIPDGIRAIYESDVRRRTYGDPSTFDPAYTASLLASPLDVIRTYFFEWGAIPFVVWLPGASLKWMLIVALAGLAFRHIARAPDVKRDLVLLAVFALVPLSWFVLGKAHSYIHTHMNYVLWYLGFASALLYVFLNSVLAMGLESAKKLKALGAGRL